MIYEKALNVFKIDYLIGGSLGGQQALEWSILESEAIKNQNFNCFQCQHSAWGIAFNELQRQAIELGENGKEEEKQKSTFLSA